MSNSVVKQLKEMKEERAKKKAEAFIEELVDDIQYYANKAHSNKVKVRIKFFKGLAHLYVNDECKVRYEMYHYGDTSAEHFAFCHSYLRDEGFRDFTREASTDYAKIYCIGFNL